MLILNLTSNQNSYCTKIAILCSFLLLLSFVPGRQVVLDVLDTIGHLNELGLVQRTAGLQVLDLLLHVDLLHVRHCLAGGAAAAALNICISSLLHS